MESRLLAMHSTLWKAGHVRPVLWHGPWLGYGSIGSQKWIEVDICLDVSEIFGRLTYRLVPGWFDPTESGDGFHGRVSSWGNSGIAQVGFKPEHFHLRMGAT